MFESRHIDVRLFDRPQAASLLLTNHCAVTLETTMERSGRRMTETEFWEKILKAMLAQHANGRWDKVAYELYLPFEHKKEKD